MLNQPNGMAMSFGKAGQFLALYVVNDQLDGNEVEVELGHGGTLQQRRAYDGDYGLASLLLSKRKTASRRASSLTIND